MAALTDHVIEWAGQPVASIKKGLGSAAKNAKLAGVSAHVLRHSAAVWLAENGRPMSEIAQYPTRASPSGSMRGILPIICEPPPTPSTSAWFK